jgi:small nuclear ribonucleoprotein (snRNP)-like protein
MSAIADPLLSLRQLVGQPVVAVLRRRNRVVAGRLVAFDEHSNVVLDGCQERDGASNAVLATSAARYIRGDDVVAIASPSL